MVRKTNGRCAIGEEEEEATWAPTRRKRPRRCQQERSDGTGIDEEKEVVVQPLRREVVWRLGIMGKEGGVV